MISESNRREFDDLGVDQLRKRVELSVYSPEKSKEAREYLDEKNPAWVSARAALSAGKRATIALVISGASLLLSAFQCFQGK